MAIGAWDAAVAVLGWVWGSSWLALHLLAAVALALLVLVALAVAAGHLAWRLFPNLTAVSLSHLFGMPETDSSTSARWFRRYLRRFRRRPPGEELVKDLPLGGRRYVIFTDCHRGDGSWSDDFARNQMLYFHALEHYAGSTPAYECIDVGDADELWEVPRFKDVLGAHSHIFWRLKRFHDPDPAKTRLHMVWGNHDMERRRARTVDDTLGTVLPSVRVYEGVTVTGSVAKGAKSRGVRLYLVHGHQGSLVHDVLWARWRRFTRLTGAAFKALQDYLGVQDPTSPAKNNDALDAVEQRLAGWVRSANEGSGRLSVLVAGHTHRPRVPATSFLWGRVPGRDEETLKGFLSVERGLSWASRPETEVRKVGGALTVSNKDGCVTLSLKGDGSGAVVEGTGADESSGWDCEPAPDGPRVTFPERIPYLNAGSCVHPRCITAIELADGTATLVKWYVGAGAGSVEEVPLVIKREALVSLGLEDLAFPRT